MHHFFGNAIFGRVVLVATLHRRKQHHGFDEADREDTRKAFQKASQMASIVGDPSECPPIIYIGLRDSGIDILNKIASAHVSNEVLILDKFLKGTCSKCATRYLCHEDNPSDPDNQIGVAVPFSNGQNDGNIFNPYASSLCHPLFIPKHSFWSRVTGGAAHVVTLGIPMAIYKSITGELLWPTFTSKEEMCAMCNKSPGNEGCMKVHSSKYKGKTVDHTKSLDQEYERFLDVDFHDIS